MTKPNKVNILSVSQNKDPKLKYKITGNKYVLDSILIDINFNSEQVFFTRVTVGNIKDSNLNLLVHEFINKNNNLEIKVYLFGTTNTLSVEIKSIHDISLFNQICIFNNHVKFAQTNLVLNSLVKDLKKNKIQTKTDVCNKQYTLFLDKVQLDKQEQVDKLEMEEL